MTLEAYPSCRFYVEIDQLTEAVFTEVSGLQLEMDVVEYVEGGNNEFVHRLPGPTKASNLTLKRGVARTNDLFKWYSKVTAGSVQRRNVSVVMYDVQGTELTRWNFIRAYPVRWIGPQFSADAGTMAIESLELAHEGLQPG